MGHNPNLLIARDLDDAGLEVWIDFRNIQGGDLWREAIFTGISQSEVLIVLLSEGSVESEWVRRELLVARGQHKFVIPIMLATALMRWQNMMKRNGFRTSRSLALKHKGTSELFPSCYTPSPAQPAVSQMRIAPSAPPLAGRRCPARSMPPHFLWDPTTGDPIRTLTGHGDQVTN